MRGSAGRNVRIDGIGQNASARSVSHYGEEDETLENPPDGAPPLVAAPRHLRRRRLHGDIPDALLVPGAQLFDIPSRAARTASPAAAAKPGRPESAASHRRKRLVAVSIVALVSVCLPFLVLLLLLSP
jgi:hypothetical protein